MQLEELNTYYRVSPGKNLPNNAKNANFHSNDLLVVHSSTKDTSYNNIIGIPMRRLNTNCWPQEEQWAFNWLALRARQLNTHCSSFGQQFVFNLLMGTPIMYYFLDTLNVPHSTKPRKFRAKVIQKGKPFAHRQISELNPKWLNLVVGHKLVVTRSRTILSRIIGVTLSVTCEMGFSPLKWVRNNKFARIIS